MQIDAGFVPNGITESNISALLTLESESCERRICELSELASEARDFVLGYIRDGYGICEAFSMFESVLPIGRAKAHPLALDENLSRLSSYLTGAEVTDRAVFIELLLSSLKSAGVSLTESDFLGSSQPDESVIYVKNRLADEAFDVFAEEMNEPTVRYASSFKEAAREVAEGRVGYCLLPLEEKAGARIPSISALLFAEDLKISSVTPVFGFDGTADMKYALVSRDFSVPPVRQDDDRYLEIRMVSESQRLAELFTVATHYGTEIYAVNTAHLSSEDTEARFVNVVLKAPGKSFVPHLAYLTLFSDSTTEVGIYTNLE